MKKFAFVWAAALVVYVGAVLLFVTSIHPGGAISFGLGALAGLGAQLTALVLAEPPL